VNERHLHGLGDYSFGPLFPASRKMRDPRLNYFDIQRDPFVPNRTLVLFDDGDEVMVMMEDEEVRFLLISGRPIGEPIAWYGPIVINTWEELRIAFEEYDNGTFIKHKK